jgi:hypothetical protein
MTDQSIEDASRKEFQQWLFSTNEGFDINDPDDYEQIINQRETSYMWEAWQAARQSSQSEPVGYFISCDDADKPNGVFYGFRQELESAKGLAEALSKFPNVKISPAYLVAPQQAIPSGYALVPYDVLARIKNLPRFSFLSPPEGGVRRFADTSGNWIEQYEVIKLLDDYIFSASPTAPIERDK